MYATHLLADALTAAWNDLQDCNTKCMHFNAMQYTLSSLNRTCIDGQMAEI